MNTQSLEFYQSEISIPTLSMELNRTEIKDILRKNKGNNAYVIYGKPELMISEYAQLEVHLEEEKLMLIVMLYVLETNLL